MPSPITPNEIKNTLPNVDAGVCDRLKKVIIDFPRKVYAWLSYVYNDDGTFTEEFKQELCAIKCDQIIVKPPKPPCDPMTEDCEEITGTIDPVTGLQAGPWQRHSGGITLIWTPGITPAGSPATRYDIYRTPTIVARLAQDFDDLANTMTVHELPDDIPSGAIITFDGPTGSNSGTSITLTAKAAAGAEVIYGTWASGSVVNLEEGHLPATSARLIRSDTAPQPSQSFGAEASNNYIMLREDGKCIYTDRTGGKIWDGTQHVTELPSVPELRVWANRIVGGKRYNYWVVAKDDYSNKSGFSNRAVGFSKFVQGFVATEAADKGLIYTGRNVQVVPSSYQGAGKFLRLILRGGGGAGAGGGDWAVPTATDYTITSLVRNADNTLDITLDAIVSHFKPLQEINITDNTNLKFNTSYILEEVNANTIKTVANLQVDGETPGVTKGRVYRSADKQKVAVAGAGGGGGGLLVAVFNISNIDEVRVTTFDSRTSPRELNYRLPEANTTAYPSPYPILAHAIFQTTNNLGGHKGKFPYHHGGIGRKDAATAPLAGEPKNSVTFASGTTRATETTSSDLHDAYDAPYFTVFEVSSDSGTNWHEIARVEDGEGGGYRDAVESDRHSLGGKGGGSKYITDKTAHKGYTITTPSNMENSGAVTLRTTALGYIPDSPSLAVNDLESGAFFVPGVDGNDSHIDAYPAEEVKGTAGCGGFIYDGLHGLAAARPQESIENQVKTNTWTRPGNAFDLNAPGSGGSGCSGATNKEEGQMAWGGHALAGSAWVTYSGTAYDTY